MLTLRDMFRLIIFFSLVILLTTCHNAVDRMMPTYNRGGYGIEIFRSKTSLNGALIAGSILDLDTREPVKSGFVSFGCQKVSIDSAGQFFGRENILENFFITAIAIGYRSVETEPFSLSAGDSVNFVFFLAQDDRPLYECNKLP
jgi:hypothetical protein